MNAQISESKATIIRLKSEKSISKDSISCSSNSVDPVTVHIRQDLLLKIEELHQKLEASNQNWNEEKRALASAYAVKEQALATEHREILSNHRHEVSQLEDEIELRKESFRTLESQTILLKQKFSDANQARNKLLQELEQLKASDTSSKKCFISNEKGRKSEVVQIETEYDSKVRSLTNKVCVRFTFIVATLVTGHKDFCHNKTIGGILESPAT